MEQTAERLNRLTESQTLAMTKMSRELQAQGRDVINLSIGEPDYDTPDFIKDAAKKAIDDNFTHYPPVPGFADLREAISAKFLRDNGIKYAPEQIVVSTGAKQSIANVVLSIINFGDEVIVPVPFWVSYIEMVKMADGIPVLIPSTLESDFKITAEQLEKAITPKTRMMIFSSPCNPTGSLYTREELAELVKVIQKHPNLMIVSDEIYEHINFSGKHCSLASFNEVYNQVITINGVSKGFAMTGWRIGYIGAPLWVAKACEKMQGQFTSGTCSIAQKAAKAAVLADPSVTAPMLEGFRKRRDMVYQLLCQIPGLKVNLPPGAFYFFPDVTNFIGKSFNGKSIQNASDLCFFLLNEANVALVSGDAFGDPNCIRISYAASESKLKTAMQRITEALALLC